MRKKITAVALLVILISLLALGSAAYFTVDGRATNVVTTSGIAMSIDEAGPWVGNDGVYTLNQTVMPGQIVEKAVTIVNDGTQEAFYTRVKVEISILDGQGKTMPDDYDIYVDMDFNAEHWTLKDGWWYYSSAVDAEGITEPVFTHIMLAPGTPNEMKNAQVSIIVTAQAVQARNNPIPAGGSVAENAAGWPEN